MANRLMLHAMRSNAVIGCAGWSPRNHVFRPPISNAQPHKTPRPIANTAAAAARDNAAAAGSGHASRDVLSSSTARTSPTQPPTRGGSPGPPSAHYRFVVHPADLPGSLLNGLRSEEVPSKRDGPSPALQS